MTDGGNIQVTVVMRSYNDARLLPRTLAALDAQQGVDSCGVDSRRSGCDRDRGRVEGGRLEG